MANRNNNNINFDIPTPIIILAFIFCWPIGIVLTVLRSISIPVNKTNHADNRAGGANYSYSYAPMGNNDSSSGMGKKSGKKRKSHNVSAGTKWSRAITIISFIIGIIALISAGSTATGLADMLQRLLTVSPIFALSGISYIISKLFSNRDSRYGRIRAIIGNRESINLTKLAIASNENIKSIRNDVQRMIDKGEFGEYAYIDLGTNNFMSSPYATPDDPEQFDYRKVYGDILKDKKGKKGQPSAEEAQETSETPADETSEDGDDFSKLIREIRRLNDEILDKQVSDKIYRIEEHTKNIFDYVRDHPEAMPQIRTFMNYYLPTTLKLLESYSRIERVGVAGENMKKSKEKIESILDLLAIGFEQQVDQLFKNESIDISSDISVLETMMHKDGLNGKADFDIMKTSEYVDGYSDDISDDISQFGGAAARSASNGDEKN